MWLYVPEPAHGNRLVIGPDGSPEQPGGLAAWSATTAYMVGQMIKDSGNNTELCLAAGTSGATAPAWPNAPGPPITDGTAAWLFVGAYGAYCAGATEGAITSTLTPKYEEIGADQVSSPINVVMTADAYEIERHDQAVEPCQPDQLPSAGHLLHRHGRQSALRRAVV